MTAKVRILVDRIFSRKVCRFWQQKQFAKDGTLPRASHNAESIASLHAEMWPALSSCCPKAIDDLNCKTPTEAYMSSKARVLVDRISFRDIEHARGIQDGWYALYTCSAPSIDWMTPKNIVRRSTSIATQKVDHCTRFLLSFHHWFRVFGSASSNTCLRITRRSRQ